MKSIERFFLVIILLSFCFPIGEASPLNNVTENTSAYIDYVNENLKNISLQDLTRSLIELNTLYKNEKQKTILNQIYNIPEGASEKICSSYIEELNQSYQIKICKANTNLTLLQDLISKLERSIQTFENMKSLDQKLKEEESDDSLYKKSIKLYSKSMSEYKGYIQKQLDNINEKYENHSYFFKDLKQDIEGLDEINVNIKVGWNLYYKPACDNDISMIRYFERISVLPGVSLEERMKAYRELAIVFRKNKNMDKCLEYFKIYQKAIQNTADNCGIKINLKEDTDLKDIVIYSEQRNIHLQNTAVTVCHKDNIIKKQEIDPFKRVERLYKKTLENKSDCRIQIITHGGLRNDIDNSINIEEEDIKSVRKVSVLLKDRGFTRDALKYYRLYRKIISQEAARWRGEVSFLEDSELRELEVTLMRMEGNMKLAKSNGVERKSTKRHTWVW